MKRFLRNAGRVLLMLLLTAVLVAGALNARTPGTVTVSGILEWLGIRPAPHPVSSPDRIEITFLDVGQGDSCLIVSPEFCALIDAGTADGTGAIEAALGSYGIRTLDALFLTHPHADHIGAAATVLREYGVKQVYEADIPEELLPDTWSYESVQKETELRSIPRTVLRAGDTVKVPVDRENGREAVLTVLHSGGSGDLNGCSMVLRLTYDRFTALFMADAEIETELELLDGGYDLDADVLKVGHHGSKASASAYFLDRVLPGTAVISCGADNGYGYPKESTVGRLERAGAVVYVTAKNGNIRCVSDGKATEVTCEKQPERSE